MDVGTISNIASQSISQYAAQKLLTLRRKQQLPQLRLLAMHIQSIFLTQRRRHRRKRQPIQWTTQLPTQKVCPQTRFRLCKMNLTQMKMQCLT